MSKRVAQKKNRNQMYPKFYRKIGDTNMVQCSRLNFLEALRDGKLTIESKVELHGYRTTTYVGTDWSGYKLQLRAVDKIANEVAS